MPFNPLLSAGFQANPKLIIDEKTTDYTLNQADNYKIIKVTSTLPTLIILPNNISAGFECFIVQNGIGVVQYQQANGATLRSINGHQKLAGQYGVLHIAVTSNSNGTSAEWQVISADSIAGAIAVLPTNFTELFGHRFSVNANLTMSGANVVGVIGGTGTQPFNLVNTTTPGNFTYSGTKATRSSGKTALVGGGLNKVDAVTLSSITDFTLIALAYHTHAGYVLASYQPLLQFYNASGASGGVLQLCWTTQSGIFFNNGNSSARQCIEDLNPHLIIMTRNSGQLNFYVDGVLCGENTNNSVINSTGIVYNNVLSSSGSTSVAGTMAIMDCVFYTRGINAQEVQNIDEYYKALFSQDYKSSTLTATNLWIYNSNSIGAGFYYGNANTPSARTFKLLNDTYSKPITRWYNISKGRITTQQMATDAPKYIDPFWSQCTGQKNLILHEGTNDINLNNVTGQQAYDNLKNYWQARKTAGCNRVFVATILPRTTMNGTQNTARLACNALIRSNAVADGATAIIDFDNDFNPSTANANLQNAANTTYYLDGVHPTTTGAEEMAKTLSAALNSFV